MGIQVKKRLIRKKHRSHEDRIAYIHKAIWDGRFPTVGDLVRETGFRRHVILEDVQYLRKFKGFPVKVSRAKGRRSGYYYDGPVPEKISNTFNERGVMDLALACRSVANLPVKGKDRISPDMDPISQILVPHTKLIMDSVSETVFFRPFAPEEIDMGKYMTLAQGVRTRCEIEFLYLKNLASTPEFKRVRIYCFVCAGNCWYMIGLDVEKNEMRTYLLSRVSHPALTEVKFKDPKFDLDKYLFGAFIIMKGNESHDIVLEFSPWAATYIENRTFTRDQKVEKLPDGGLRMSFWLSSLVEVECWVRHWGPNCKVISSEGLKQRLRDYRDFLGYLG